MSGPSRFCLTNLAALRSIVPAGSVLQNGTGGGAPALVQDASYPMTNAMRDDRYALWNTGAAPASPFTVDLTMNATAALTAMSVSAIRSVAGAAVSKVEFYTQTGAYTPAGAWTLRGTVNNPGRNCGVVYAAANADSLRYKFTTTGQFQASRLFAGVPFTVGAGTYVADNGAESSPQRNATLYSLPSGATFEFLLGDNSRDITLMFSQLSSADADALEGLAASTRAFTFIDDRDRFWDCILADKQATVTHTSPTAYSVALHLTGLA